MNIPWHILLILRTLLGIGLIAFCGYTVSAMWGAWQWRHAFQPLNPRWTPAVTIFKPVCGVDAEAYDNFASYCKLDYPTGRFQILFGALDEDDPAIDLIHRLQRENRHLDIGIVVGTPRLRQGNNLKVCNLLNMESQAKYDLFVLCDSDMRVKSDYLRRITAPFEPGAAHSKSRTTASTTSLPVGMVTCPYRGCRVHSIAAVLESLGIGADFIPSTLVSRAFEGVSFALGSTIVVPRTVLAELGGFENLLDELADDFLLGNGASKAGYEVVISDYVVDDVLGRESLLRMWARRLRWARTVRAYRPVGYIGAGVLHGIAISTAFLIAMQFSLAGWMVLFATVIIRVLSAICITKVWTDDPNVLRFWPLLPLSDLITFALYLASFLGNRITWRGVSFKLLPGGRIERLTPN